MNSRKALAFSFFSFLVSLGMAAADAQPYPSRPVRVVVPLTPGGGVDTMARIVSEHLGNTLGQRFIVDNRPGAGGSIGVETVAKATPDGHTLLVSSSSLVTNAAVQNVRYDPVRDFQPVSQFTSNAYIVLVTPSLAVLSVGDLVALARSQPGKVTYGSSGVGGVLHLAGELLCVLAGVKMTHVPYRGVADAYPAVMSGQVNWLIGNPISAMPQMKAGRLRGIAVTGASRMKAVPELPTVAESGVPGYSVDAWFGMFAPAGVPPRVIEALSREAGKAVRTPELARRMDAEGTEVVGNTPKEFGARVREEYAKWRGLVAKAGLRIEQ
jgi:tripartite-type tricarboxylate transporter receptor subunit TctC